MIEVSPFHSKNHLDVHHTCSVCCIGKMIHPKNKASGSGGLRLCLRCEKLLAKERSQTLPPQDLRQEVAGC